MNWIKIYFIPLIFMNLTSCQSTNPTSTVQWHSIRGRESSVALYRAQVPMHWICQDLSSSARLADTTQPVCELLIIKGKEQIRITMHPFPYTAESVRIPPQAQIARWKNQLESINLLKTTVHACSHGGFHGLCLESEGQQQGQPVSILGWSFQLAQFYDQQLDLENDQPKRADYTIKAVGPSALMQHYRQEIIAFAESFELIDELPSPL
jgi:hypothetical protein